MIQVKIIIVLNKRLDDRVDEMIEKGLVKEIEEFKTEFELHNPEYILHHFFICF